MYQRFVRFQRGSYETTVGYKKVLSPDMKCKFSVVRFNHEKKTNIQIKNPKKEIEENKYIKRQYKKTPAFYWFHIKCYVCYLFVN